MLTEIVHVTAAYSNAVLVAILPHITDYARKLELHVPLPITQSQVSRFNVDPLQGNIGGGLWLTNGFHFVFENGYVNTFDIRTNNPWITDDPATDWPRYIGKQNMTTNEAIEFARAQIVKLGYGPSLLQADVSPLSFEGPYDLKEGHFPYCQIKWNKEINTLEDVTNSAAVTVQIDMAAKSLLGLTIISRRIWRPNPDVVVKPELEKDFRERTKAKMFFNTNAPKVLKHD